jgi:hypothetical protein
MRNLATPITIMALFAAGPAFAWGEAGHEVVGVIAYPWNNLHSYWDTEVVAQLGDSPVDIAMRLDRDITPAKAADWVKGGPRDWAMQTFTVARNDTYNLPSRPTCNERGSVALSEAYQARGRQDAVIQLERAGVRLAYVLNTALGP